MLLPVFLRSGIENFSVGIVLSSKILEEHGEMNH